MVETMTRHGVWTERCRINRRTNWTYVSGVSNRAVNDIMTSSNLTPPFMVRPTEKIKSNDSRYLQLYSTLKIERSLHLFIQYTFLEHLSCVKEYAICGDSNVQRTIRYEAEALFLQMLISNSSPILSIIFFNRGLFLL